MPEQTTVHTPENWDASSHDYATKVAPRLMEPFAEEFVRLLDVSPDHEVLEVACGSGAITMTLAEKTDSLMATDFAPQMIEIVRSKIKERGLSHVSLAVMDGQRLDLEDNSVDRATCCFGLMLFPDRRQGFSELNRVLRPGGKAVVTGWGGPDKFEGFALLMAAMQRAFPDMPKPDSPPPLFSLANLESFKSQMEAGGFKEVETHYVTRDTTGSDFEDLWSFFSVGAPPVKVLFDKIGQEGKGKLRESLAQIVHERYGNGPITLSNSATVGVGTAS